MTGKEIVPVDQGERQQVQVGNKFAMLEVEEVMEDAEKQNHLNDNNVEAQPGTKSLCWQHSCNKYFLPRGSYSGHQSLRTLAQHIDKEKIIDDEIKKFKSNERVK